MGEEHPLLTSVFEIVDDNIVGGCGVVLECHTEISLQHGHVDWCVSTVK